MKELDRRKRQLVAVYLLWVFINIIAWTMSDGEDSSTFWPENGANLTGEYGSYDFSEFLVYAVGPLVIFIVYSIYSGKE
jgi:hypothetical protein